MISISQTPRVAACPASEVLPHAHQSEVSPQAARGIAVHAFLAACLDIGRDEALKYAPEAYRDECEAIDLSRLPAGKPDQFAAEVAFAFNWKTGSAREIGRNIGRAYEGKFDPKCEIPGAADSVGLYAAGSTVFISDTKTGYADLGEAGESWQLKTLALAAARAYGVNNARVSFHVVRDGVSFEIGADLGEMDLDAHAEAVKAMMLRVEETRRWPKMEAIDVTEGPYCKYCPAFDACPAKSKLAVALANLAEDEGLGHIENDSAARALINYRRAVELLEHVKERIDEYAARTPVELGGGKVYGIQESIIDTIVPDRALGIIAETFGVDVANEAREEKVSVTKTALKAAIVRHLGAEAGRGVAAKSFDATIEKLREAGAIVETKRKSFREFRAKPKELGDGT